MCRFDSALLPIFFNQAVDILFNDGGFTRIDEFNFVGINIYSNNIMSLISQATKAHTAYGCDIVSERHRHRYEFNNKFRKKLEAAGLVFSGQWPERKLMEIVEVKNHPYMVGCQFHPEFKTRPHKPHPLFKGLMEAIK